MSDTLAIGQTKDYDDLTMRLSDIKMLAAMIDEMEGTLVNDVLSNAALLARVIIEKVVAAEAAAAAVYATLRGPK